MSASTADKAPSFLHYLHPPSVGPPSLLPRQSVRPSSFLSPHLFMGPSGRDGHGRRPDDVGRGPLTPLGHPPSTVPRSPFTSPLSVRIPFMPPRDIRALRHPAAATKWVERGRLGNLALPRSLHSSEASQIRQGLPHSVRARDIILRRLSNVEGGVPK